MVRENKPLIVALVISFAIIIILLGVLLFVLLNKTEAETSNTQQIQSSANSELQGCINNAHSKWDGEIAIEESSGNANTGQSLLDQDIASCHQRFGY